MKDRATLTEALRRLDALPPEWRDYARFLLLVSVAFAKSRAEDADLDDSILNADLVVHPVRVN